jgi:argininosuccinate lyase
MVNLSPLGAVALASTGLPISRERSAALLGFGGLVEGAFDAVAATDYVVQAATAAAAIAAPLGRLLTEWLAWLRDQPDSLRLGDRWVTGDPGLPQLRRPTGVERLVLLTRRAGLNAAEVAATASHVVYEPLGPALDGILDGASTAIEIAGRVAESVTALLAENFDVNRAYLANRAGRAYITASDLAVFLMTDEGLDPAAAANVAALTISRAHAEGVEISGVTPQMIDGAAMMVIGRELGVEFEAISRHLAPRRFIERRTATGGPAPAKVREQLDLDRRRLDEDRQWRLETEGRLAAADHDLDRLTEEAATGRG